MVGRIEILDKAKIHSMKFNSTVRTLLVAFPFIGLPAFVYSQAANDNCAGFVTLTPSSSCSTTAGDLYKATNSASAPAGNCGGATATTTYDVWFRFTANSSTQSITVNSLGNKLSTATTFVEVLSGSCGAFTSSLACQSVASSLIVSGLTVGTIYYVRVYVTSAPTANPSSQWGFNICIQGPPANDDCAGAVSLTPGTTCSATSTTINLATATTGLPAGCESGGTHYDVWYTFTAGSTYELISLTGLGTSFTNPELQLYSGTCGSLTSVQCGTTSMTATGLTVGNTYYVRVSNVGSAVSSNGGFSICVYHPASATYDYGKSYVNISRNSGGGTINPGDTLEVRATLVVRSQSLDSLAFFDTLKAGGGLQLVPGTIALRTNEGKIYRRDSPTKSAFTDAFDSDAGYYYQSGSDTVVRINIGVGATGTQRGKLASTDRPSVFGTTCIIMATYRVVVYEPYNSTINLGGGAITIKDHNTGISGNLAFSPRNAIVYSSPGLCPNAVSATNAIGGDFNGTFGTPTAGPPLARNRVPSPNVPGYIYNTFSSAGGPQDYFYGIANNTSQNFSTVTTWAKPDVSPTHRVFNVWDITGDHTGSTNTTKGNPPCDTTLPISATNPCGYMLIINSAYKTDTAFQYTVTNLCPNTYYEISTWLKNICYKCSCDSNGTGASQIATPAYIPFAPNDSSGVQPNLAFDINGTDYYTTGNIPYAGIFPATQAGSDSTNTWVKRGFTYLTGTSQTSLTLTIRNNAPGGGGNDWALDDISLSTCFPTMSYSPTSTPMVCENNQLQIGDTVRSEFSNYIYYVWQRSQDGGATWTDVTSIQTATPTFNGSQWVYITNYTVPPTATNLSDSGDIYRVYTGTTVSNITNPNCIANDGSAPISLTVFNCGPPLKVDLISFSGKLNYGNADLLWVTSKEDEPVSYNVEKSTDGTHFTSIATVNGHGNSQDNNYYQFTDPVAVSGKVWYRIAIVNKDGHKKYSRIISLSDKTVEFSFSNAVNPFSHELDFEILVPENTRVDATLISLSGRPVRKESFIVYEGVNSLIIPNTESLPAGIYVLQIKSSDKVISKKLMKK